MNVRDRARLKRIIDSNAREYRDHRRRIALAVMRGAPDAATLADAQRWLSLHASAIAEAVATLTEHVDPETP